MVRGLRQFKEHFALYTDRYVLIGGTACTVIMENAGFDFRATKDLDIVLQIEALDSTFVKAFWDFIKKGGYQNQQRSAGKEVFYRFNSPSNYDFPAILELFCRMPDSVNLNEGNHLTPIPLDKASVSLSAILLDDDYYQFIHAGKCEVDGLSVVGAIHLIPLKAKAWLDLIDKEDSDSKDIRKHKNDVIRLYQLLSPNDQVTIPLRIKQDMRQFVNRLENDKLSINLKNLSIKHTSFEEILINLKRIYGID